MLQEGESPKEFLEHTKLELFHDQVFCFTPKGQLDRSLAVPVKKPAMCAFGGVGMDTLFVTSIRPAEDLSDQPLAGGVFALQPGVRGLDEPRWVP